MQRKKKTFKITRSYVDIESRLYSLLLNSQFKTHFLTAIVLRSFDQMTIAYRNRDLRSKDQRSLMPCPKVILTKVMLQTRLKCLKSYLLLREQSKLRNRINLRICWKSWNNPETGKISGKVTNHKICEQ